MKSDERLMMEHLLEEYGLLFEGELYNPKTKRYLKATGQNIRRVYDTITDEIERSIEDAYQVYVGDEMANMIRLEEKKEKEEKSNVEIKIEREEKKQRETKSDEYMIYADKKNQGYTDLFDILNKYMGKHINVRWHNLNVFYNIPIDFEEVYLDWQHNSELSKFQYEFLYNKGRYPIIIDVLGEAEEKRHEQRFSEGISHCVFTPIKTWCEDRISNYNSKYTVSKFKTILNNINKYIQEYKDGLPENQVESVCSKLQIRIEISTPLNDGFINYKSHVKPLKIFKFINTRFNHVNEVVNTSDIFKVETIEDMIKIKEKLDKDNEFYTYKKSKYIHTINTLSGTYKLDNEYNEIINDFENKYDISTYKIDDITQPELSQFVREGVHYNATIDFNYNNLIFDTRTTRLNETVKHIDMEKAYTQFKKCKYYNGFLGKITDFRQTAELKKINNEYINGLYRVDNISFKNCELSFKKIIKKLNCYNNGLIYSTPELLFLIENKVKFSILEGAWGVVNKDLEFPESFNNLSSDNIKIYAKYVGSCNSHNLNNRICMNGTKEYFENMRCFTDKTFFYNNNMAVVEYKKNHNFHFSHFTAYITAYQRLNAFEQLLTIPYENIIRICVDGIYYTGNVELKNAFREKEDILLSNVAGNSYISGITNNYTLTTNKDRSLNHIELHKGAGGTGKTHYNLTDKGNVKMLYVAPSWKLATNKKQEYKINSSVVARLISKDPEVIREFKTYYNVLVFDEVSMYSKQEVEYIINTYKEHKLIFCGDIGYQLPCISGETITADFFKNHYEYTESHRFKDEHIKKLCSYVRKDIADNIFNVKSKIITFFKDNIPDHIINKEQLYKSYDIKDMILSSTHENKDEITDHFKGKFEKEKFYFTKSNDGYYNGSITIQEKDFNIKNCEIRHSFTIHCIQGETASHNLFIDMRKIRNTQMIYTALSRAKNINQIYLVI